MPCLNFPSSEDKQKVYTERLWTLFKFLLDTQRMAPKFNVREHRFLYNMVLGLSLWFTIQLVKVDNAIQIYNLFTGLEEIDLSLEDNIGWATYMRIKIWVW